MKKLLMMTTAAAAFALTVPFTGAAQANGYGATTHAAYSAPAQKVFRGKAPVAIVGTDKKVTHADSGVWGWQQYDFVTGAIVSKGACGNSHLLKLVGEVYADLIKEGKTTAMALCFMGIQSMNPDTKGFKNVHTIAAGADVWMPSQAFLKSLETEEGYAKAKAFMEESRKVRAANRAEDVELRKEGAALLSNHGKELVLVLRGYNERLKKAESALLRDTHINMMKRVIREGVESGEFTPLMVAAFVDEIGMTLEVLQGLPGAITALEDWQAEVNTWQAKVDERLGAVEVVAEDATKEAARAHRRINYLTVNGGAIDQHILQWATTAMAEGGSLWKMLQETPTGFGPEDLEEGGALARAFQEAIQTELLEDGLIAVHVGGKLAGFLTEADLKDDGRIGGLLTQKLTDHLNSDAFKVAVEAIAKQSADARIEVALADGGKIATAINTAVESLDLPTDEEVAKQALALLGVVPTEGQSYAERLKEVVTAMVTEAHSSTDTDAPADVTVVNQIYIDLAERLGLDSSGESVDVPSLIGTLVAQANKAATALEGKIGKADEVNTTLTTTVETAADADGILKETIAQANEVNTTLEAKAEAAAAKIAELEAFLVAREGEQDSDSEEIAMLRSELGLLRAEFNGFVNGLQTDDKRDCTVCCQSISPTPQAPATLADPCAGANNANVGNVGASSGQTPILASNGMGANLLSAPIAGYPFWQWLIGGLVASMIAALVIAAMRKQRPDQQQNQAAPQPQTDPALVDALRDLAASNRAANQAPAAAPQPAIIMVPGGGGAPANAQANTPVAAPVAGDVNQRLNAVEARLVTVGDVEVDALYRQLQGAADGANFQADLQLTSVDGSVRTHRIGVTKVNGNQFQFTAGVTDINTPCNVSRLSKILEQAAGRQGSLA